VGVLIWLVWLLVMVVVAAITATLAEARGQQPAPWFVLGWVAPIVSILVLLIFFDARAGQVTRHRVPSPREAARTNPVAKALADAPATAEELAVRVDLRASAVAGDLRALRTLGLATRGEAGRWQLTADGLAAIGADETSG
jgi:Na+-transporting methylmalonyl-CoA/oxaloacetate decarboxylase gamma subunit